MPYEPRTSPQVPMLRRSSARRPNPRTVAPSARLCGGQWRGASDVGIYHRRLWFGCTRWPAAGRAKSPRAAMPLSSIFLTLLDGANT